MEGNIRSGCDTHAPGGWGDVSPYLSGIFSGDSDAARVYGENRRFRAPLAAVGLEPQQRCPNPPGTVGIS